MKYLIVVVHLDEEVIGAGASIRKWETMGTSDIQKVIKGRRR